MRGNLYIYILVMAAVTYLIRMLPLVLSRKEIKSRFIRSFLYYVPYACLSAMTFPAIIYAPRVESIPDMVTSIAGAAGFAAAVVSAYKNLSLLKVALIACAAVFLTERIILFFL